MDEARQDKIKRELVRIGRVVNDHENENGRFVTVTAPEPREAAYLARAALRDMFAHTSNVSSWGQGYSFSVYTKRPACMARGVYHQPGAFGESTQITFKKGPGPEEAPPALVEWYADAAGDYFGHERARDFGRLYAAYMGSAKGFYMTRAELEEAARDWMGVDPATLKRWEELAEETLEEEMEA